MSFFKRGTLAERKNETRGNLPDSISDDVFSNILVKYFSDLNIDALMTLSAGDLCKRLQDQKEGPRLIDEFLEQDDLLKHLLKLTAGTKDRKTYCFMREDFLGRNANAQPLSEEVTKTEYGLYLIGLCRHSEKVKNFILQHAERLKKDGLIDDVVIQDINNMGKEASISPYGCFHY